MNKSLKKILGVVIAGTLTIGLLGGCGGQKQAANEIKIGGNFGLTGGIATFGNSSKNAINMAVKEINASGGVLGKQITFVFADNKSEAAEAAAAATKLITQDKVVAVLGPIASSNVLAASQIHIDNKIPLLTATATNPKVTVDEKTGKVKDYIFRACFIDPFQGTVMANFAAKSLNGKTAAILTDNSSDYSKGLTQVFKESFVKAGGTIVAEEAFLQKDQDFKATLTKVKSKSPDVIFIPAYYEEAGKIVKQARELGITVPMLGTDGWDSPKMVEIAGGAALNGTYFSNHYSPDDTSPAVQKFVAAYKREFGQTPDALAALAYDATLMIADAIKRAGSAEPAKINDALAATKGLQVVSGVINLDEQHNPIKSAVVIEFKDGAQVFKEKVNP